MTISFQGLKHERLIITPYLWVVFGLLVAEKSLILAEMALDA